MTFSITCISHAGSADYITFGRPTELWTEIKFQNYITSYLKGLDSEEINPLKGHVNRTESQLQNKNNSTSYFSYEQALDVIKIIVEQNQDKIIVWLNDPEGFESRVFTFEFTEPIGFGYKNKNIYEKISFFAARLVLTKTSQNELIITSSSPILNYFL